VTEVRENITPTQENIALAKALVRMGWAIRGFYMAANRKLVDDMVAAFGAIRARYRCHFGPLECGGSCDLEEGHSGPHLCAGDVDGPGSCPA
jgi:hypothetical protein